MRFAVIRGERAVRMVDLLFSFNGRINRAQYWFGCLGVGFAGALVIATAFVMAAPAPGADKTQALQTASLSLLIVGAVLVLLAWCGLALQIKRFHDRGQSGWLSAIPFAPMLGIVSAIVGSAASGAPAAAAGAAALPYVIGLWVVNLAFFINLGCLPGVSGPNTYGDPPGATPSPASPERPAGARAGAATVPGAGPSSLAGAQSAIDRAIEAQAHAVTIAPRSTSAAPSFGRRITR